MVQVRKEHQQVDIEGNHTHLQVIPNDNITAAECAMVVPCTTLGYWDTVYFYNVSKLYTILRMCKFTDDKIQTQYLSRRNDSEKSGLNLD